MQSWAKTTATEKNVRQNLSSNENEYAKYFWSEMKKIKIWKKKHKTEKLGGGSNSVIQFKTFKYAVINFP